MDKSRVAVEAAANNHPSTDDLELLTADEACQHLGGMNRATLYRGVASGRFPRPVKIGPNMARWVRGELQAVVRARIAERDGTTGRND
jgi:prophage regulatory protein